MKFKIYRNNRNSCNYKETTICQTLLSFMGTGGGNVPFVVAYDDGDPAKEVNDEMDGEKESFGFLPQMKAESQAWAKERTPALVNGTCPGHQNGVVTPEDGEVYRVRRLTPLECERLQGLPDGWTECGSDTARYKALGNGMAQPCADFIISCVVQMAAVSEKCGNPQKSKTTKQKESKTPDERKWR